MNILISSLGITPQIVEEALGLFNGGRHDFYNHHPNEEYIKQLRAELRIADADAVDEVWLIATDRPHSVLASGREMTSTVEDFEWLVQKEELYAVRFRLFLLSGIADICSQQEARAYHDLALRVVAHAHEVKDGGKLYVSLACGRKTMSADLQDATYCFGCDLLMHVLGDRVVEALPLSLGRVQANESLSMRGTALAEGQIVRVKNDDAQLLTDIEMQKSMSQHFYTTYYLEQKDKNNFHILYTLPPSKIDSLKKEMIGMDKEKESEELDYLRQLPKTELHCHLGGVLSPAEMIDVAACYEEQIDREASANGAYSNWLKQLPQYAGTLNEAPANWKVWYNTLSMQLNVHKGLIVAPFLLCFREHPERLEYLVYDSYTDDTEFQNIGIDAYEALGDLQGSALLCNENAIRRTVQILLENCERENVKYLEVRCSPINYKYKKLTPQKVLRAIIEELDKKNDTIKSSLLVIASRHNEQQKIAESISLVRSMRGNPLFDKYFRGFDLAGAEGANEARTFRDLFLEVMKDCQNITIHAGETENSDSIWQAVYHLNAERIGHGLTLIENTDLQNKFLERGIGIEMCPSSNYQIEGFRDNYYPDATYSLKLYPLKTYLGHELKVSVNTDDPGISRTNITRELHKAARLTPGGLSKWDILQLLCNGFRSAFYPYSDKKSLIITAEQEIAKLIKQDRL